jgi:hypothetical protein
METLLKSKVDQLCEIYYKQENWHESKIPYEDAVKYHTKLFNQGNIQIYEIDGIVLGYFEVFFINFEQFGRIVAHAPFNQMDEDVISGKLAYVSNTWIHPDYRKGAVYKILRNRFFKMCNHADYYCGVAVRKTSAQPVKVFQVSKLKSKLYKGE